MRSGGWRLLAPIVMVLVFAGCDGDGIDGVNPPVNGSFDAAAWDGTWDGQWLNQTFASTGGANFEVAVDDVARTVDVVIDLDGSVFGGTDPAPIDMSLDYDETGLDSEVNGTVLGDLAFTVDANGSIQGRFTNIPNAAIDRVTFTGQRNADVITINYTVQFAAGGNSATGTITVNKQ